MSEIFDLAAFEAEVRAGARFLWHGGFSGLQVGDDLLPPEVTEASNMRDEALRDGAGRIVAFHESVYVTSERDLAAAFAANYHRRTRRRGSLYRIVLAADSLSFDRDLPRGPFICFEVRSARVADIVQRYVDPDDPKHVEVTRKFVRRIR
jgi:hypothetical protein